MTTAKSPGAETLVAKLARIADAIGQKEPEIHRSREGGRSGVKFPYFSARDVYGWWRPLLHAESLLLIPEVLSYQVLPMDMPRAEGGVRKTLVTTAHVKFTVRDGVTGEWLEGSVLAQGEDPSDKGAGKLMTYAEKVFLLGVGMNGYERDNEEDARDEDDRDYRRRDSRDDRDYDDRGRRDVVVTDSNIEGIQRGGRSNKANEVQIQAVKQKARELNIGIRGVAEFVDTVLHIEVRLPDDPNEAAQALARSLADLSSEQIGELISYMDLSLRQGSNDDRDGYEGHDSGYGG